MQAPFEVDVTTAAQMMIEGALLLDVREPHEFAFCAVAGSRHIPMRRIPESTQELPPDRPVLVLCHHGGRSQQVAHFLRAHGFPRATNVAGGIDAWADRIDPSLARY